MAKNNYENWSKDDLIKEIGRLRKNKRYGLVWEDKPEDVVEQCKTELPVLDEVKNKEINSNPDAPVNLLIEGDNYHALSVLNYTHQGKVDVIYIDPPYNTGNKSWRYNNRFVEKDDAFRHSKWISFMAHRLILAKNLLAPSGILICAIDHNEQEALGMLIQDLFFAYKNTCITIVHNPRGIQGKNFSYMHENAYFVYPNDGAKYIADRDRDEALERNFRVDGGNSARSTSRTCFYPFLVKDKKIIDIGEVSSDNFHPKAQTLIDSNGIAHVYPIDINNIERKWSFSRKKVKDILDELYIKERKGRIEIHRTKDKTPQKTVWIGPRYDANEYGSKVVNSIVDSPFPFPKSLYTVMDCIEATVHDKDNALILDFFAGSGTTGHAILELNKQDNGNRKFILCTNNENEIATDVCYPRIRKVIKGYKNGEKKNEGLGGNLRYFRTSFVSAEQTDKNRIQLTKKATAMLCMREDTFELVQDEKEFKIFKSKDRHTGIIFDQLAIENFKKIITKINSSFSIYVFSLSDDTFDDEFADMKDKVTLSPIPEAILRVYRRIFK